MFRPDWPDASGPMLSDGFLLSKVFVMNLCQASSAQAKGWTVLRPQGRVSLLAQLAALGAIIQTTEITPRANAKAALATDKEMQLHTDHPRARWISWECVRQSSEGGYSLLKDTKPALDSLTESERDELRALAIRTHVVFPDDTGAYPILRADGDGADWIYFTPWMTDGQSSPAFRKFTQALEATPTLTLRLYPGESLLIDNGRMLHGRSALGGDKDRLLIRRWIASPFDTFGRASSREANAVG
jgi:alpha-ketoglutarate-dependent taurine dioxygenase